MAHLVSLRLAVFSLVVFALSGTASAQKKPIIDYIKPPPDRVAAESSYFTIAGDYPSFADATRGLTVLRSKEHDIRFAVFAPYGERRR